jgi:hypothetical protein
MKRVIKLSENDLTKIIKKLITEQSDDEWGTTGVWLEENYIEPLKNDGYIEVEKIDLPNGDYKKWGGGHQIDLKDGVIDTGYIIITENGIRGSYGGKTTIKINNGIVTNTGISGEVYKYLYKEEYM